MTQIHKIGLVNVGVSNIASVERMLDRVGARTLLINKRDQLEQVSKVILPGVGHFDEGIKRLRTAALDEAITDLVLGHQIVIMGICLGMQLLCRDSEEGSAAGLGLIDASVRKLRVETGQPFKVPQMGWNVVRTVKPNGLLPEGLEEQRFYFVHSYKVVPRDPTIIIGEADHGGNFCAAFQKDNIYGVQFHPEKSHRFGMALMKRFLEL